MNWKHHYSVFRHLSDDNCLMPDAGLSTLLENRVLQERHTRFGVTAAVGINYVNIFN